MSRGPRMRPQARAASAPGVPGSLVGSSDYSAGTWTPFLLTVLLIGTSIWRVLVA
jgi:hypothetical protein